MEWKRMESNGIEWNRMESNGRTDLNKVYSSIL